MPRNHDPTYIDLVIAYGLDARARRLVLVGPLDDPDEHGKNPYEQIVRGLLYLDQSPGDIELRICTVGGPSARMFGLYDTIRGCKNKVHTIGFGEIFSAGVLLLAAGDKRSVTENSWLMSHAEALDESDAGAGGGEVWTVKQRVDWVLQMEEQWAVCMAKHTRRGKKWWHELHQGRHREKWWPASEMKALGIVDEIIMPFAPPETPKTRRRAPAKPRNGGRV